MDKHEKLAKWFLKSKGYDPEFEPLGYQTIPDFKIANNVAIEVRRLNQYVQVGNSQQPIEKYRYKMERVIRSIASNIEFDPLKPSYYYYANYDRELIVNRSLKRLLSSTLKDVLHSKKSRIKVQINSKLTISFEKTTKYNDRNFIEGGINDNDPGILVSSNIINTLSIAIEEKGSKAQNHFHLFSEWWLVLVDYIGFGIRLGENEIVDIQNVDIRPFSKVYILSPETGEDLILIKSQRPNQ